MRMKILYANHSVCKLTQNTKVREPRLGALPNNLGLNKPIKPSLVCPPCTSVFLEEATGPHPVPGLSLHKALPRLSSMCVQVTHLVIQPQEQL